VAGAPEGQGGPGRTAFVVLAGGSGSRVGAGINKVYLPLAGRRVISWSFVWARQVPEIGRFVLVVRAADVELARDTMARELPGLAVDVVEGGATRHDSEQAALEHLSSAIARGEVQVVAVHDGARPLAGPALVRSLVTTAAAQGGAVPAVPAEGLLPVDADGRPTPGADADGDAGLPGQPHLARVQTPQAFRATDLLAAYAAAARDGYRGTDTASSMEAYAPVPVRVVAGSRQNLKITYPHDLALAERLLAAHDYRLP
jgi:2-C-methyl-D-erythritol 4-phosphate cytidylyltransferase